MEHEMFRAIVLRNLVDFEETHASFHPSLSKSTGKQWLSLFLGAERRLEAKKSRSAGRLQMTMDE